jgi:arginyl-tRNA--protein-N-Asp/Glu arginylyltransferase
MKILMIHLESLKMKEFILDWAPIICIIEIDGKLVAVTVIDIVTKVFTSDYCIWDPDYAFLSLGVVSAIREFEYMKFLREKDIFLI